MESTQPCAKIELTRAAAVLPSWPVRAVGSVRRHGMSHVVRRVAEKTGLARPTRTQTAPLKKKWPPRDDESLGLSPGEIVQVKSAEEIQETLDEAGMYRGLYFMGEMWKYSGQTFTVKKRVESILVEATGELHDGIKNTVLLENSCCDGSDHQGCDANCYHFWREVWLRRPTGA